MDSCCVNEGATCLYVSVEDLQSALGECPLEEDALESLIMDAMCTIDSYIGVANEGGSYFPRQCDNGCIPFDVSRVALYLTMQMAKAACLGCQKNYDPNLVKSVSNGSHSITFKDSKTDDGFGEIPQKYKNWLKKYRLSGGYWGKPNLNCKFKSRKCFDKCGDVKMPYRAGRYAV